MIGHDRPLTKPSLSELRQASQFTEYHNELLRTHQRQQRPCSFAQPNAAITSGGACTNSISTPSPEIGNSSLLLGCINVMS